MKISQMSLAIAVSIDQFFASARMNRYESGQRTPDYLTLKRVGKVLGCSVAYFYAEDDIVAEIIIKLSSLKREQRKQVLEIFSAL